MKKIALISFLIICSESLIFGQAEKNKNFIYTFSDSLVFGKTIEYKQPFLGSSYFLVDSKKIQSDLVKFYRNESGFYANSKTINFSGTSSFSKRIRKGNINLFEKVRTSYHPGHLNSATGMFAGGMANSSIKNYYNKGFDDLKKANFQNLSLDLADNSASVFYLNKFKKIRDTQTVLYVASGIAFITGVATLLNKTKDWDGTDSQPRPNVTGNLFVIGAGVGFLGISYYIGFSKPRHLRSAIDKYNE